MALRTRLVAAFVLLLLVVVAIVGIVVVGSSRSVLTSQIDEDLEKIRGGVKLRGFQAADWARKLGVEDDQEKRRLASEEAILVVDADGVVIGDQPSGFADDPDPLPDIEALPTLLGGGGIATIPSEDGALNYRAFAWETGDGEVVVWAVPLGEVDAAVGEIVRVFLLAGAGAGLLGGAVTWWMVRRELRPVDRMVSTATAIAGGDLTQRVPDTNLSTELGRLGAALNDMLTQIQDAFAREQGAKERLTQFVADASHELRTPIAAVQGYNELYRVGALGETGDLDNAMRRIRIETSRMERLVTDLLLLARLDQAQAMEHVPVNLAAVVRDAVTESRAIDPDRLVTVDGPDSVRVIGDEQRLTQVVANLLANTRLHTPKGTPVALTLRQDDSHVTLDVVDDGPGLPEKEVDKLFERFYRTDTSRTRRSGGTGLGLAIVAAIVRAHGGTVEAANQEGHGARFTITLPTKV